ncbi:hypothetical protein ABEF95_009481 [Exophiala dermatitidis]
MPTMGSSSAAMRDRGSPRPRKPRLSLDAVSKYFSISYKTDNPNYRDIKWEPRDTRFVFWYYLTTNLPFASIAIAFNSTYPDNVVEMSAEDAQGIVSSINVNFVFFKDGLRRGGHWTRPDLVGWAPCDHEMCCSKLAALENAVSVNRSPNPRTRQDQEIAEKATALWQGTWAELLTCPRDHGDDSHTSRPRARSPSFDIYVDPSERSSRSASKASSGTAGKSRASAGNNALQSIEEKAPLDIWVDPDCRGPQASGHVPAGSTRRSRSAMRLSSAPPETGRSSSDRRTRSSYHSSKSRQSDRVSVAGSRASNAPSQRSETQGTNIEQGNRREEGRFQELLAFAKEADALWFLLENTLVFGAWIFALDTLAKLIMRSFGRSTSVLSKLIPIVPALVLILVWACIGARQSIRTQLNFIRRTLLFRHEIVPVPTGPSGLSLGASVLLLALAMCLAAGISFTRGELDHVVQLLNKIAAQFESREHRAR